MNVEKLKSNNAPSGNGRMVEISHESIGSSTEKLVNGQNDHQESNGMDKENLDKGNGSKEMHLNDRIDDRNENSIDKLDSKSETVDNTNVLNNSNNDLVMETEEVPESPGKQSKQEKNDSSVLSNESNIENSNSNFTIDSANISISPSLNSEGKESEKSEDRECSNRLSGSSNNLMNESNDCLIISTPTKDPSQKRIVENEESEMKKSDRQTNEVQGDKGKEIIYSKEQNDKMDSSEHAAKQSEKFSNKHELIKRFSVDSKELHPVASLLCDVAVDSIKEVLYKDLLRVQNKRARQNKLAQKECDQLETLKQTVSDHRKRVRYMPVATLTCKRCTFRSEIQNVMSWHEEFAHRDCNGAYQCNLCSYQDEFSVNFFKHMEDVHGRKGRVQQKPNFLDCKICTFQCSSLALMRKHVVKCNQTFILKRNLEPKNSDNDIPVKLKRQPKAKPKSVLKPAKQPVKARSPASNAHIFPDPRTNVAPNASVMSHGGLVFTTPNVPSNLVQVPSSSLQSSMMAQFSMSFQNQKYTFVRHNGQILMQPIIAAPVTKPMVPLQLRPVIPQSEITPRPKSKSVTKSAPSKKDSTLEICEICGGFLNDRESLRIHLYWCHEIDIDYNLMKNGNPSIACDACDKKFWTNAGYKHHRSTKHTVKTLMHSKPKTRVCPICLAGGERVSLGIDVMAIHLREVHNVSLTTIERYHTCPLCAKKLEVGASSRRHHLLHEHMEIFLLSREIGMSNSDKPVSLPPPRKPTVYSCKTCNKKFSNASKLGTHVSEKHLYKCRFCLQRWNSAKLLREHINAAHSSESEHCQICGQKVSIGRAMIRHLRRSHCKDLKVVVEKLPENAYRYISKSQDIPKPTVVIERVDGTDHI